MYYTMLSKDEKAYLNILKAKKEDLENQFRRINYEYRRIEEEIESILKNQDFHQMTLEEVNNM